MRVIIIIIKDKIKVNLKKYNRDISEFEISYCSSITHLNNQEEKRNLEVKFHPSGTYDPRYIGYPEDVKEEMDNLEELGIDKMMLWGIFKSSQSESIKDPLEIFASKVMN